jgi:hypothetical protein
MTHWSRQAGKRICQYMAKLTKNARSALLALPAEAGKVRD